MLASAAVGGSLLAACTTDDGPPGHEKRDVAAPAPDAGSVFLPESSGGSDFPFEPLPFDEAPSMLTVVGERSVYAVLGSANRLWLRTGSIYYEGHRWGAVAKLERDGPAFTSLHGYTIPGAVFPRVYVAHSDASLRPVAPEGIGPPVAFCTSPSSCRSTADVVSVVGPADARGAVWMLRDPEGLSFYVEESPARFVRSALAPLSGVSRVLSLTDDPPGIAAALERDGAWSLVRLAADAASVREELALPEGHDYVQLARGADVSFGDHEPDALHVLVAGTAGGEAALEIAGGAISLSWRWRGTVPAGTSWYGRGYPPSSTAPRASCLLAGGELVCRTRLDREPDRASDVLAACHSRMHLFSLEEADAGGYVARVQAYYGPLFP